MTEEYHLSTTVLLLHIVPLFIAYAIVTPVSVLFTRFFRKKTKQWYNYHLNLQLVSHALTAVGIIAPFFFFVDHEKYTHFTHLHGWAGAVLAITTVFIQPILGTVDERDNLSVSDQLKTLHRHSVVGRCMFLFAFSVMYMGVQLIRPPSKIFDSIDLFNVCDVSFHLVIIFLVILMIPKANIYLVEFVSNSILCFLGIQKKKNKNVI